MEKFLFKIVRRFIIYFKFYDTNWKRKIFKKFFEKNKKINSDFFLKINNFKDGYLKISSDEMKKNNYYEKVFSTAKNIITNTSSSKGTKKYLRNILVNSNDDQIKTFLNFVLDDKIIEEVSKYIQEVPLLTELKLLHSPANLKDDLSGSQMYHRDFDDEKIVKLFFYLVDIDENTGPLEIVKINKSKEITPKLASPYVIHSDQEIENLVDYSKDCFACYGKKGDCYLVDTSSCFHRGSRHSLKDRYILYANFSSRSSFRFPPIFRNSNDFEILNFHSPLNTYQKLVDQDKKKYLINRI